MKTKLPKKSNFINPILAAFKQDLLKIYGDKLLGIILFGSYARGDFREDSDVDLLLLFDQHFKGLGKDDAIFDLILDCMITEKKVIAPIAVCAKDFIQQKSSLYLNIQKEGVLLWGKTLSKK